MSSSRYDRIGPGDLLTTANTILLSSLREAGWGFSYAGRLVNKAGSIRGLTQAHVYDIEKDGRKFTVPLAAKSYTIDHEGEKWFSVSERIIYAAETNVVFTYIADLGYIVATDRMVCTEDLAMGEHYLRYFERYHGWKLSDSIRMTEFLEDPQLLDPEYRKAKQPPGAVQTSLEA